MNRRNFLKLIAAVAVCPKNLLTREDKFPIIVTEHTLLNGSKFKKYHIDYNKNLTDAERIKLQQKLHDAIQRDKIKFKKPLTRGKQVCYTYHAKYNRNMGFIFDA